MAHAAQPSEWDLGAGKTHNRENLAIFSSLHAEVDGIVVVPLMLIGQTEVRGGKYGCPGLFWVNIRRCCANRIVKVIVK